MALAYSSRSRELYDEARRHHQQAPFLIHLQLHLLAIRELLGKGIKILRHRLLRCQPLANLLDREELQARNSRSQGHHYLDQNHLFEDHKLWHLAVDLQ
jgi:hypothetical protein